MDKERVIGEFECANMVSSWTEYLCMEMHPDGSVTLTSKGPVVLGGYGDLDGEVVWPEGYEPEDDEEYDPEAGEDDERPLPVSIGGKEVVSYNEGMYFGSELVPSYDDSMATFKQGESQEARKWVLEYYAGAFAEVDESVLKIIDEALQAPPAGP